MFEPSWFMFTSCYKVINNATIKKPFVWMVIYDANVMSHNDEITGLLDSLDDQKINYLVSHTSSSFMLFEEMAIQDPLVCKLSYGLNIKASAPFDLNRFLRSKYSDHEISSTIGMINYCNLIREGSIC